MPFPRAHRRSKGNDAEETIFVAQRPAIVNRINDFAENADLADRSCFLHPRVLVTAPIPGRGATVTKGRAHDAFAPSLTGAASDPAKRVIAASRLSATIS